MTIINKLRACIIEHKLIDEGDHIIIGASGGPDSQFLIYGLKDLMKEMNFTITLAHLNHLHRKEAIFDEQLVEATAKKLGLLFKKKRASMDSYAKQEGLSSEDAGRRLRYEFFRQLKGDNPKAKIAVAHNLDDQAETVLMRIIRGTGIEGLRAMDYKNADIIRPILDIRKSEILAYLNENNIAYAIDKTNLETDYTRNKIRLELIPWIEKINPNFKNSLVNLSKLSRQEIEISDSYLANIYEECLSLRQKDAISFKKDKFEALSRALRARIIRYAIFDLKKKIRDISKENIDSFLALTSLANGKAIIKDDLVFYKSYNFYRLSINEGKNLMPSDEAYLDIGESLSFGAKIISLSEVTNYDKKSSRNIEYFDRDKLTFPLKIRYRKAGDRFKPLGMDHNKKLKDFFIDLKVDKFKRDKIPLILSENDIIWVTSFRSSEDYKIDPSTKNIVKIEVKDDN